MKVAAIGGGAASFFFAINLAEKCPEAEIQVYEQGRTVLNKVRISGGGRCNVTHACFVPKELVKYYPRGEKELLGPFHTFACGDTFEWFEKKGVDLKIEEDGRAFPSSDSSATIIDCFHQLCHHYNIQIHCQSKITGIQLSSSQKWELAGVPDVSFDYIFVGTGSSESFWKILESLNHQIVTPVPSLFTFNIKNSILEGLPGISLPNVEVNIKTLGLKESGPILITHWGLSGPGILKLSSRAARELNDMQYQFEIAIDWLPHISEEDIISAKVDLGGKPVASKCPFGIPSRLWERIINATHLTRKRWADINKSEMNLLVEQLKACKFKVDGKSTFKDEFVTAGGVELKEIDFKHFRSKYYPTMYLAGEVLNIDALTGGFNFQAAWTGAYIAASSIAHLK